MNPTVKTARKTIRVVLAEDQGMILGALATLLEIEGDISVVARARNGADALQAILSHKPDIFLTDIEMPEMSGLDVAAEMRRLINSSLWPSNSCQILWESPSSALTD